MSDPNNRESRPSKRSFNGRPKNNDKQIEDWLENLEEEEFSEVDDSFEDPNFEIEQNLSPSSEQDSENRDFQGESSESEGKSSDSEEAKSETENDGDNQPLRVRAIQEHGRSVTNYIGKNGFLWSKTEIARTSRTPAHNIIHVSRSTQPLVFQSFIDIWSKIFDSELVSKIVTFTNQKLLTYRERFRNTNRQELKDTNETEMLSLLGLLYYSSVFKCNGADASYLFATDGTGHEIFRCVMSKYRFCTLLNCLRFDDGTDRQNRLKTDPLAAVSWMFDKFVSNSQQNYTLGPNACIDEMLIPFKGRCKFRMYMPNKPAKYGIKVMILCDAEKFYTYNAYIYSGKNSDGAGLSDTERKLGVPTQSVLRLSKPIENSNRNITADNWFSSIQLIENLKSKKLTYLGTLKKNKREIPPEFKPSKHREVRSSIYGFTKDFTLLSFVQKQNKAVILVSSSHHSESTDDLTKKPTMIVDYNHTKGGVDEIDKKCAYYSCSRKTRRWPMAIFYRIVDLAGVNTFILYQECPGAKMRRGDFLLSLARDLVLPSLKERVYNDRLPRELRLTLKRVLGKDMPSQPEPLPRPGSSSARKLCGICPSRLKRQTRFTCCSCKKPICLQCSAQICEDCKFEV